MAQIVIHIGSDFPDGLGSPSQIGFPSDYEKLLSISLKDGLAVPINPIASHKVICSKCSPVCEKDKGVLGWND
jgi:hypothetical protein